MNNWIVYKHIAPSDKVYIGITGMTPAQRWIRGRGYKHQPLFNNAIQKYGWDSFEHIVLMGGLTKEEAIEVEIQLIEYYKSIGMSYNISDGGEGATGYVHSDEYKKKMSDMMKARKHTPEMIKKWKKTMAMFPYHPSDETKKKIAAAAKIQDHTKASHIAAQKRSIALYVVDNENNIIIEFASQQDAAKYFGVSDWSIANATGKNKIFSWATGYIVRKNEYLEAKLKEE